MTQRSVNNPSKRHENSQLSRRFRDIKTHLPLILIFIPGFTLFLVFRYGPMYGLLIAFKDYQILDGVFASPWVGFSHFYRLFSGYGFVNALRNTVIIAVLQLVFVFPAPIVLALLLNEIRILTFRKVIQTVSYLPHFFSWVILSGILFRFLSYDGTFNYVITRLGFEQVNFLIESNYFYGVVVVSAIWQRIGWSSIIYFAALSSVDVTLYEAAIVDGANRWRQVWHITIPSIMPTIIIMLLLHIGDFLRVGFDQIYNLMTATTSQVGDILDTYVLRRLLAIDYELGTAAGLFSSVIGLILVLISNRLVKLYDETVGLW